MILTAKQQQGLDCIIQKFKNKERYAIISGYAGTGKSTLVKFAIAALSQYGIDPEEDVVYTSFTGKATQVLQKKGNSNVSTLHKLLYESYLGSDGKYHRKIRASIDYKVVVIDEISMVPKQMLQLLYTFPVFIICLGDPGQLPPIRENEDNFLLNKPDVFLDEIMRQAQESEIIRLTMDIREGRPLKLQQGKEVQVISSEQLNTGMLQWADQIICAKNETRTNLNMQMRDLLGHGEMPEDGDKVICLHNYWDEESISSGMPLVNGTIGYLKNPFSDKVIFPGNFFGQNFPKAIDTITTDFVTDTGEVYGGLIMDKKKILQGENSITNPVATYRIMNSKKFNWLLPKDFTYGYAITGHKSQGSEWDKVLVLEESFPFKRDEHIKWLYTVATRSAEKLVIVRKD